jgi:hypothetical protein
MQSFAAAIAAAVLEAAQSIMPALTIQHGQSNRNRYQNAKRPGSAGPFIKRFLEECLLALFFRRLFWRH